MKVSELGEFGLIDLLAKMIADSQSQQPVPHPPLIGIGDDAAAWHSEISTQLATTDSLIQDIHFSFNTISCKELGWKSLAVNLSDIAAMGGVPGYALISLALPAETQVDDVAALYEGMIELAQQYQVAIVGGDTCRSPVVSITVTVLGITHGKNMLRRATAMPGDSIAVTGYLGSAAACLEMFNNNLKFSAEVTAYLRDSFHKPLPRIAEGQLLAEQGIITAIDISDGLLADLTHICRASNVSARVESGRLPVHPMVKDSFGEKALELALSGGEDYELLFTGTAGIITRASADLSCPVNIIGEITAGKPGEINLFNIHGKPVRLSGTGWEHFKTG